MFTGLVETTGTVLDRRDEQDSARLTITAPSLAATAKHGDSVAVDGVCLSVVEHDETRLGFDVMGETLRRSTIGRLQVGDTVNLERPVRPDGRLAGHVVQGHVDGVGEVVARRDAAHWRTVRFSIPADMARYVAEKGSVAVAGTSLTVADVSEAPEPRPWFEVGLIPTTLQDTTLGDLVVGDEVNVEVDVLAKYLARAQACDEAGAGEER